MKYVYLLLTIAFQVFTAKAQEFEPKISIPPVKVVPVLSKIIKIEVHEFPLMQIDLSIDLRLQSLRQANGGFSMLSERPTSSSQTNTRFRMPTLFEQKEKPEGKAQFSIGGQNATSRTGTIPGTELYSTPIFTRTYDPYTGRPIIRRF